VDWTGDCPPHGQPRLRRRPLPVHTTRALGGGDWLGCRRLSASSQDLATGAWHFNFPRVTGGTGTTSNGARRR
jgi:hypothetical protein